MDFVTSRRGVIKGILVAGGGLAAPAIITRPGWSQTKPIKIGNVVPLSGPGKEYGEIAVAQMEFIANTANKAGGVLGRQIVNVVGEAELTKPEVGNRRARELILDEKVDFATCFTGSVATVLSQLCNRANKIFLTVNSVSQNMLEQEFVPTNFYCALSMGMQARAMAHFAANSRFKRVHMINSDFAMGRTFHEVFLKRFNEIKRSDQQLLKSEFVPLNEIRDFGPYITGITSSGADLVVSGMFGQDMRLFLQQGHSFGWSVKVAGTLLHDPIVAQSLGDAIVGNYAVNSYMLTIDNPLNKQLIDEWSAVHAQGPVYLRMPEQTIARSYFAWKWLFDVIARAGTLDTAAVVKAFEGSKYETPWGEATMRPCDHQALTGAHFAEFLPPAQIPENIRYFGNQFPYLGMATPISEEATLFPQTEVNNPRCRIKT